MNAPTPDPAAPLWLIVVSVVTAAVTAIDLFLRVLAPLTKTKIDDEALSWTERALAWLKKLNPLGVLAIVALAVSAGLALTACPGPTPRPVQDVIDCTKLEGSQAWTEVQAKLFPDFATADWHKLVADVESIGVQFGYDTARCVAMEMIQQYLSTRQLATDVTWDAHAAAAQIRDNAGGATFRTSEGDL